MTRKKRDPLALGAKKRRAGAHRSKRKKIRQAIADTEAREEIHARKSR